MKSKSLLTLPVEKYRRTCLFYFFCFPYHYFFPYDYLIVSFPYQRALAVSAFSLYTLVIFFPEHNSFLQIVHLVLAPLHLLSLLNLRGDWQQYCGLSGVYCYSVWIVTSLL